MLPALKNDNPTLQLFWLGYVDRLAETENVLRDLVGLKAASGGCCCEECRRCLRARVLAVRKSFTLANARAFPN